MTGRRWGLATVAALAVLNALVVATLFTRQPHSATQRPEVETPVATEEALLPAPQPETPEPSPPTPLQPPTLASRQIVAVEPGIAWRATLASCGHGGAVIERTLDGGTSWQTTAAEIASVVRLRAAGSTSAFVVGAGADCATALESTFDGGESWSRADTSLSTAWYLAPTDRSFVSGPRGDGPVPCGTGAVDLAALDAQRGAILCQDGSLSVSVDGGGSWSSSVSVAGGRAVAQSGSGYVVATFEGQCDQLSLYMVGAGGEADVEPFACVPTRPAAEVAVAVLDSAVWVWSGADLLVSEDGGQTW